MRLFFVENTDPPAVLCPIFHKTIGVNVCGSCTRRHVIEFGEGYVECEDIHAYPRWSARIGVRLSERELDRLDSFCEKREDNRSHVIREALKHFLNEQPGKEM